MTPEARVPRRRLLQLAALGAGAAFSRMCLAFGGGAPRIGAGISPWGFASVSAEWTRGRAAPFLELRAQAGRFDLPFLRGLSLSAVALVGYRHDLL